MRKLKYGCLATMLAAGMYLLSGCSPMDESVLDTAADLSVSISVPYATATPLPDYLDVPDPVVIDPNGVVTVNDTSLLPSNASIGKEDNSNYHTLSLGDTGLAVQALQQRLQDLRYFMKGVSGVFDADTEAAVKRFEQSYGIMQTGIATAAFQEKLFSASAVIYGTEEYEQAVVSQYTTLQKGAVGSTVYALQHRLKELGYPIKELTAVYDEDTEQAIRLFYQAYGQDGNVAYVSLQKELYSSDAIPYSIDGEVQASTDDDTMLKPGNVGTLVMQLQERLIELRYMSSPASGIYDSETEAAVRLFETACGFEETGTLSYTLQAILLSEQAPVYGSTYSADQTTYSDLSEGSEGESVLALQQRLIELGYAAGAGNGVYGTETTAAIRMFQHYNDLEETGSATAEVQSLLFSPSALSYQDVLNGITTRSTPMPAASTPTPSPSAGIESEGASTSATLAQGASGAEVQRLQERLNEIGYACTVSGSFDEETADAVRALQSAIGVTQSGELDEAAVRYIYSNAAPHSELQLYNSTQSYTTLQSGDQGEAVTNLQKRLWRLGYLLTEDVEDSVGSYHAATAQAVSDAQRAMGYEEADGIASAEFQCFLFSEYGEKIKK